MFIDISLRLYCGGANRIGYTIKNRTSPTAQTHGQYIVREVPRQLPDGPAHTPAVGEAHGWSATALIAALVAGDEKALAAAYDLYSTRVYGLAIRVVGDHARAEEVTQDVFAAAWRNRATFDQNRGSLLAWLLTAARNRSIDVIRGHASMQSMEVLLPLELRSPANVEETVFDTLDQHAIIAALQSLPQNQRLAIEKAYFGGLSAREIAADLRVPMSTVKGRLRLGLRRLGSDLALRSAIRLVA